MVLRQKYRNQFLFLVRKVKHDCSCRAKNLALTLWWPLTNKITGTQYHHKLIFYSSCHVPRRVLGGATKVEQGTIMVGGERILVITGALTVTTVTQRATSFHYRWYMFLFHWIIQSSFRLSCPCSVNSHPALHITLLVITSALLARKLHQRAISCHNRWYLCLLHWMIHPLINFGCPRFVNSHPALHITQRMSFKLLQYPAELHQIRKIPCHRRPPIMEVAILCMHVWCV